MQWTAYAAMLVVTVGLVILTLANVPRKILLFEDRLLIKHLSYRSIAIRRDEIDEVGLRRFRQVWLSRDIFRCVPLTLGLLEPGVFLKRKNGWAYFFNVRNRDELLRLTYRVLYSDSPDASAVRGAESH